MKAVIPWMHVFIGSVSIDCAVPLPSGAVSTYKHYHTQMKSHCFFEFCSFAKADIRLILEAENLVPAAFRDPKDTALWCWRAVI